MTSMCTRAAVVIAAVLLASADAAIADTGEVVLVGDASEVRGCQRLGEVAASSLLGGVLASQGRKHTITTLKERAKALGATHIQLLSSNTGYAGSNMLGVAYRCATSATDSAQPSP